MHFAGWVLVVLGCLGSGALLLDILRKGVEEDRVGGLVVGLLVAAGGVALLLLT